MRDSFRDAAVRLIFSGQVGLVEVAPGSPSTRRCLSGPNEFLAAIDRCRYFGPLTRKRYPGSTIADVSEFGDVLWADGDAIHDKGAIATEAEVSTLRSRLETAWRQLGLAPSIIVFSGNRGVHSYWKLPRSIPKAEIGELNRRLAHWLETDTAVWQVNHLLRVPGSRHELTGRTADVLHLSSHTIDPELFYALLPALPTPARTVSAPPTHALSSADRVSYPRPWLTAAITRYSANPPEKGKVDRSSQEQAIFTHLACQGWSDEQIIQFAHDRRLPRHIEEWFRRRPHGSWTRKAITDARAHLLEKGVITVPEGGPTNHNGILVPVGETLQMVLRRERRPHYRHVDRGRMLYFVRGQTSRELTNEWMGDSGCSQRTAYNILKSYVEGGLVSKDGKGKNTRVHLTDYAKERMMSRDQRKGNIISVPLINPKLIYPDGTPRTIRTVRLQPPKK